MAHIMKTILITNRPDIADDALAAGVTRIMVDLESMGKAERQKNRKTFISTHRPEDVAVMRKATEGHEMIVRINPWHDGSTAELNHAIRHGADMVMLPMISNIVQFEAFIAALDGRAAPLPLIETAYSMQHIDAIAACPDVRELYIGLNDLHLSLGLDFLFEPLALGLLDTMAATIRARGKAFGFGGITAISSGELPSQRVLGEHARLGSTCVILSSRFYKDVQIDLAAGRRERLRQAVNELQNTYQALLARSEEQQRKDAEETFALIHQLAQAARQRNRSAS